MLNRLPKAPLYAAFFCAVILAGCKQEQTHPQAVTVKCPAQTTPISNVQGDKAKSPMLGQQVTVQGIVTLVQSAQGFYIEEPGSDSDDDTSNAIFIRSGDLPAGVGPGALISTKGTVSELGEGSRSLTALTDPWDIIQCASDQSLPLTDVSLPLNGYARESIEGMRIQINDTLVATDVYQFGRGKFTLSGNGLQFVPTEVMAPGGEAARAASLNRAFALPVMLSDEVSFPDLLVSGATIDQITGVVAHDGRELRLALQSSSALSNSIITAPEVAAADSLRIVGMNLHNYFNGDGKGQGFPTPRGAETAEEFNHQRDRIGAAIKSLNPHVLAVMELENDGFDAASAAQDFIHLATQATGKSWAVTRPEADNTGTDKITVGIFYRTDLLKAVGPAQTLSGPEFKRSRQPQAQLFQMLPGSDKILIVINHLKSKGSCPDSGDDADQKDGQGCWNPMRKAAAQKMATWARNVAAAKGTDNILILGDMNAYRKEDPIEAIRHAGFTELMDDGQRQEYSFVFYGQHGTLDYAFSSEALLKMNPKAFIWHANVALPSNIELPQPWLRFSDHDPVVVDIRVRQASTSD